MNYLLKIKCSDVGIPIDIAEANIIFSISIDNNAPILTRAFGGSNQINVKSNEESSCYYSNNNCNFNLINGTLMTSSEHNTRHTISSARAGAVYYIKCKDVFGNQLDSCSIIAQLGK